MATRPKAIIESRNGEKFSPITIAKNVLTDDGQNLYDILSDRKEDMMTPTIENSSSMFKAGQGDNVDYSNNVVNGAYENMVLKGKTMVNCIQEPSSQDVVLPYEFAEGQYVTINDTKESGTLGVELKGQTLVNIHDKKTPALAAAQNDWYSNLVIETNSISFTVAKLPENWRYINFKSLNLSMLKPNTKYLVAFEEASGVSTVTFNNGGGTHPLSDTVQIVNNKAIVTTTSNWVNSAQILFIYVPANKVGTEVKVKNPMIIEYVEGMENWDIPYFEGMTSCKMPILHTVGKNVVNEKIWKTEVEEEGYQCLLSAGFATEAIKSGNPIIIPVHVEKDKVYTLKCKNKATRHFNYFYLMDDLLNGKVKSFRRSIGTNMTLNSFVDTIITFTADRDYKYLQIDTGESDANGYIVKNTLQLEEGSVATAYEPYKSSILSLPEEVVLRSLPNGVCDIFNTRTGEYVQRIGEITLDGNTRHTFNNNNSDNVNVFYFDNIVPNKKFTGYAQENQQLIQCDSLKTGLNFNNWDSTESEYSLANTATGFWIFVPKSIPQSWLAQNPVTAQYELATPIITKINLPSALKSWNTATHIYSEIPENTLYPILSHSNPTYPVILKPSTKYSIVANSYSNSHTNSAIKFNLGGAAASATVGNRVTTITTPSTLSNELLTMSGRGNKLNNVMVIEGDVIGDEPYFEGICDCKSPILSNVGKNLFDGEIEAGRWLTSGNLGKYNVTTGFRSANIITITPSSRYTISGSFKAIGYFVFGNKDGYITRYIGLPRSSQSMSFNTNPDEYYGVWYTVDIEQTEANKPTNIQLEETSTATPYEPYKSNILSVNGDKIELTEDMFEQGTLHYEQNTFEDAKKFADGDTSTKSLRIRSKKLIKVKPNTTYRFSYKNSCQSWFYGYDMNENPTNCKSTVVGTTEQVFTTNANTHYLAFVLFKTGNPNITPSSYDYDSVQIREVDKTIVLRSLPNGVCDTLNVETGEYVQRIGDYTVNGTETSWFTFIDTTGVTNNYLNQTSCAFGIHLTGKANGNGILCDKLPTRSIGWWGYEHTGEGICGIEYDNRIFLRVKNEKTGVLYTDNGSTALEKAKTYLASNPVTVQYELATPIVSTIDIQGFPYAYTNGHVQLSSGSIEQSLTPKVEYSVVTNRNGQIRSNQKMVERHQKQLDCLQAMILTNLVNTQYEQTLTNLKYDLKNVREEVK